MKKQISLNRLCNDFVSRAGIIELGNTFDICFNIFEEKKSFILTSHCFRTALRKSQWAFQWSHYHITKAPGCPSEPQLRLVWVAIVHATVGDPT